MKHWLFVLMALMLFNCAGPEPRRPVKVKSGTFFGGDIERNKKLLAAEEKLIQDIIAKDSLHLYESSNSGFWYYYQQRNDDSDYVSQTDDLVTLTYNILSLGNDTLYSSDEIGEVRYKVDKQEIFLGLRNSIKLLKENETATFLYPSSLAYGYQGDGDRIGVNEPIKSTLTILKIEKDSIGNR